MRAIPIDPADNFAAIRDRLLQMEPGIDAGNRVVLVLPDLPACSLRTIDLVLLRRLADRERLEVGLITSNQTVTQQARELGLPTFRSKSLAEHYRPGWWRSHRRRIQLGFAPGHDRFSPAKRVKGYQAESAQTSSLPYSWIVFGLIALLLIALALIVATVTIPRAAITLRPRTQAIQVIVPVTADPDLAGVDETTNTVPARLLRLSQPWVAAGPSTGDLDTDRRRVRAQALQGLGNVAPDLLAARLASGELLVPGAVNLSVVEETAARDGGEVSVSMQVELSGLAVGLNDLLHVLAKPLSSTLPPGFDVLSNTTRVNVSAIPGESAGRFEATARADGRAQPNVEALRQALRWQRISAVRRYLESLPLAEAPEIRLTPSWWASWSGRLPYLAERITIEVIP